MSSSVSFEEIVDVKIDNRGKTPPTVVSGHPLIEVNALVNCGLHPNIKKVSKFVDEDVWQTWFRQHLQKDDVIFSTVGTIGETAIVSDNPNYAIAQNILGFRFDKDLVSPLYMLFLMRSNWFMHQVTGRTIETVQKSIKWSDMKGIKLNLPPVETQEKIAKVLCDLDRKIELNRQMNATLEQIGQTLFKKYFVDNPESEEWENVQLGNYVELVNGATYKSSELSESDCALLTLKNFKRKGGFKREGYKQFTGKFKDEQVVQDGDLVVAHTDLTQQAEVAGVPALVSGAGDFKTVGISMDVVKIIPKEKDINSGFLYFLMMSHEFQSYKMGYITGSTVLHLNKKCIPNFTFKLPDTKSLQTLGPVFKEIILKMTLNDSEIDTLEKTRDSVLPKLMSGEIKV